MTPHSRVAVCACTLALLAHSAAAQTPPAPSAPNDGEAAAYAVDYLRPPGGALVEAGGLAFLPDGQLAVSTRRGQVWLVEHALDPDPAAARFTLFAEGLQEGLGLAVDRGELLLLQRGELSRLRDTDHDGRCDTVETLANGWGLSGNYHEFAFGLPIDRAHDAFVALNVGFWEPKWWHGKSKAPWRGWIVKVTPAGEIVPFASGFRSPCGLSLSPDGELFATDNQGDWMPVGPVFHVREGKFHGHPASLAWTDAYRASNLEPSDTVPPDAERAAAALWLPYKWSRSAGNVVWDTSAGKFGPFAGQMFVSELTNGMILRASLERVRGEWQGACFLWRQKLGSVVRLAQAADGTLVCGLTNRGWGGLSPASGLARVRWTGVTPFEMHAVHLLQDGFELQFTEPLAAAPPLADVRVTQYHYDWSWQYGSPERGTRALAVRAVELDATRTRLVLRLDGLAAGEVARCVLGGVTSARGTPLLHDEFAYTVNQLPDGPVCTTPVARVIPPPTARVTEDEGWLRLGYGDAFERWHARGWQLCDVDLDRDDPRAFTVTPGVGALVNTGPDASDFTSREEFGDATYAARVFLAEGSAVELWLLGRYAVRCAAPEAGSGAQRVSHCGSVTVGDAERAPRLDAWKGAGQWHELRVAVRAPRFDPAGTKTEPARVEHVFVDDVEVAADIVLEGPSRTAFGTPADLGALAREAPRGPFVVRAHGAVAIGGLRVRPVLPVASAADNAGVIPLFDGEDLQGLTGAGGAEWKVDDDGVLAGTGAPGALWSERDDWRNVEVTATVRISAGGRAALCLRAPSAGEQAAGYQVAINSSHPSAERTGSVLGLAHVAAQLVPEDTWVELRVRCADESGGTRLSVWLAGVQFVDVLDAERRAARGRIGFVRPHAGSVLEVRALGVRALGD